MPYQMTEVGAPYSWMQRVLRGPTVAKIDDLPTYIAACRQFEVELVRMQRPAASTLLRWWLDRLEATGQPPQREDRWRIDLAEVAPRIFVQERVGDTKVIRFRYVGSTIEDYFGGKITLMESSEFSKLDTDATFNIMSRIFVSGYFFFVWLNFSVVNRSHIKATTIELPLVDPEDGTFRYSIGAMDMGH